MKIIRVSKCEECPNNDGNLQGHGNPYACYHPVFMPPRCIHDTNTIPDWCPLEDAIETT